VDVLVYKAKKLITPIVFLGKHEGVVEKPSSTTANSAQ